MIVLAIFRDRSRRRGIDGFKNLIFFLRLSYIFLPKLQHLQTVLGSGPLQDRPDGFHLGGTLRFQSTRCKSSVGK